MHHSGALWGLARRPDLGFWVRDLTELGYPLDEIADLSLGYNQTNGTDRLRELIASNYASATREQVLVTNGTAEANFLVALCLLGPGDTLALQVPNYMQMWGLPRGLGAKVVTFRLQADNAWQIDWKEFEQAVTHKTRAVYLTNPNNPTGSVLSDDARQRIIARCEEVGAYLISDEVYLGAEIHGQRTHSFWGSSDKVIVTSGLSKAYGMPGVRIGWVLGPREFVHSCWTQHDYTTIAPCKLSDGMACIAVDPPNREQLFDRTRNILQANLPLVQAWINGFAGFLSWEPPAAGAMCLLKYQTDFPSKQLAQRIQERQSTLVVPGSFLGLEGYLRIWFGGRAEYVVEGLRRVRLELNQIRP